MSIHFMIRPFLTLLFFSILFLIKAQVSQDSELFQTLKIQDSIFFERGFNQCDLDYLEQKITSDLKFFHDQSGYQSREVFFENSRKYLCSNLEKKPIRKVEPESLVVFPLYKNGVLYGAIQKGIHHFYIREDGKDDVWTSRGRFTHVWITENEEWKISEVLSYDHSSDQ